MIYPVVLDTLEIVPGNPPEDSGLLGAALKSHMVHHFKQFGKATAETHNAKRERETLNKIESAWDELLACVNCLVSAIDGNTLHYSGPSGCSNKEVVAARISRAMLNVFYARLPGKPEEGKWTKSPPAVDWLMCQSVMPVGFLEKTRRSCVQTHQADSSG